MITKEIKQNQVHALSQHFSKSKASFLVNCIGLNVEEMTGLRKNLKKNQADIKVIRNTLARLVLDKHAELKTIYESHLAGPNAFVLAFDDDVVGVAKIMEQMSQDNEIFKIKCGFLDGAAVTDKEVKILSKLPSLDILRSQMVGVLSASMTKFLGTLQAAPEKFVRLLEAYKGKQGN